MARLGRPERSRAARSFRQLMRFHHVINSDKVFGTHSPLKFPELMNFVGGGLVMAAASQIDDDEIALLSSQDGTIYLFSDGALERKMSPHPRATFLSKAVKFQE